MKKKRTTFKDFIYLFLRKKRLALLFLLFNPLLLMAEEYSFYLTEIEEIYWEKLEQNSHIARADKSGKGPVLIPNIGPKEAILEKYRGVSPDVLVEGLYLLDYPSEPREEFLLYLYNLINQVSTISGVPYFSHRKQEYRPLLTDVHRVSRAKSTDWLPDLQFKAIPHHNKIALHMREANLGRAYYEVEYLAEGEALQFTFRNTTPLTYFIKVVDTGGLTIDIVLTPAEDKILLYGYCYVTLKNPGFAFKIMDPYSSFYRRVLAIVTWLENRLHSTEKLPVIGELVRD